MHKALITGVTGFVGKWLSELLHAHGFEVHGVDRWAECQYKQVHYHQCDILDAHETLATVTSIAPDAVYHLAAISYLPDADSSPRNSLNINIMGTISVLDAVKQSSPSSKVLLVGSSKEYDDALDSECVNETTPPNPTNFYGISKYAGELIGLQYVRQYGIDVRCTRSFNHTGPGQSPRFVCSDWAKQIAAIVSGLAEPVVSVGNLGTVIDFTDVRDVVKAYFSILEMGQKGDVYNVCSGNGVSLEWILNYLICKSVIPITINRVDNKLRMHKTNIKMLGDYEKLHNHTGWKPEIPFEQTLNDTFDYWIDELKETM